MGTHDTSARSAAKPPRPVPAALLAYQAARNNACEQFTRGNRVQALWHALTQATDALLVSVALPEWVTLVAVGGYGRRELFPYSDVDVLLLVTDDAQADVDEPIAQLLQQLWDMHIAVSHATRTLAETIAAAQADHTVTASLMDARFVSGDIKAFRALKTQLKRKVFGANPHEFVSAKLAERDTRHSKWGDSRFMLEPNIKDGKGALRDLHTLAWLGCYCYGVSQVSGLVRADVLRAPEWRHYRNAYVFFATVRAHMHLLRDRADERLTFDLQTRIAVALKFRGRTAQEKAERFMLRYFQYAREVGALTRIFCALLEEENLRIPASAFVQESTAKILPQGFVLDTGRLHFAEEAALTAQPSMAVELFALAQKTGMDIHPRAHLALTRALPTIGRKLPFEGAANQRLLEILLAPQAPDITLRRMNEMGVLGALVPEFGRITGMMQYDGYHTYTVDEHTLVAVGNLWMLESGAWSAQMPLASAVAKEIADRAPLYLAMLCHDIAKGTGGRHAEKGEAVVGRIAARLGLSEGATTLAAWLVKHHLVLSETAFKRDLDDTKTIEDFVALVQSPERLRYLLLVTVADINAVGPAIWNGWKGSLMRDLYHRAMLHMGVGGGDSAPQAMIREALMADIPRKLEDSALRFMEQRVPTGWWFRPRAEQIEGVRAYAMWRAAPTHAACVVTHDTFRAVSEVTCCITHQPSVFRTLAGVMAWIGASIVSARIMVLADGAALATLGIQNIKGESFIAEKHRLNDLPTLIEKGVAGQLDFARELPKRRVISRGREVVIAPNVFHDNQVSTQATVLEVNARDRLGLLYDMLGALEDCQLQLVTAHIATYGKKAVDVFYVKDAYGLQLSHPTKLASVERALLDASAGGV